MSKNRTRKRGENAQKLADKKAAYRELKRQFQK